MTGIAQLTARAALYWAALDWADFTLACVIFGCILGVLYGVLTSDR